MSSINLKNTIRRIIHSIGFEIKKYVPENYKWLHDHGITVVLDIGANTGQFALKINEIIPNCTIHSFEPIKSCFEELVTNTRRLKIIPYNYGIGDGNYVTQINISTHAPSSSLLEMEDLHKNTFLNNEFFQVEDIIIKTLDSVATDIDLDGKSFLVKIDVQGFEDRVLRGGLATVKAARVVIIEMSYQPLYKGQLLFNEIHEILHQMGFSYYGNLYQTKNPVDGSVIYSDSIYVNTTITKN